MGDAMSASVTGAAATHYNPAGILGSVDPETTTEILLMHKEWIQSTRTEFLGAAIRLNENHALGFSLNTTTVSDIEIRTKPGPAEGTFSTRDLALGVTYATAVSPDIRAGLTARFLYEQILVDEASGLGFDLGVQFNTPVDGLIAGAAVANIGSMNSLRNASTRLPLLARAGAAYVIPVADVDGRVLLAADAEHHLRESTTLANAGLEFLYAASIALRAGYQAGSDGRGFSAGGGVRHGIFSVEYAYSRLRAGLGNGHTIAVSVLF
jgi:hypothetical protein